MEVFHTLAEISVAIAGFSSLVIVFRGSSSNWGSEDYLGFAYVLSWSIGCVFLSLLPILLHEFGIDIHRASQISLFIMPGYVLTIGSLLGYARSRINLQLGEPSSSLWKSLGGSGWVGVSMTSSALLIVFVALLAGFGVFGRELYAWYASTIAFLMMHAIAEMGVFVVQTAKQSDANQLKDTDE